MMEQKMSELIAGYESDLALLRKIEDSPLREHVSHLGSPGSNTVFIHADRISERRAAAVKLFGPDGLSGYYESIGMLALRYEHKGGISCIYFDSREEALDEISGGKCRFEERTVIDRVVVCDMDQEVRV